MEINSKREYQLSMVESGQTTTLSTKIDDILNANEKAFEYQYALQYIIDDILDLDEGDSMYFKPNRDDSDSKGIILRIK